MLLRCYGFVCSVVAMYGMCGLVCCLLVCYLFGYVFCLGLVLFTRCWLLGCLFRLLCWFAYWICGVLYDLVACLNIVLLLIVVFVCFWLWLLI